MRSSLLLALLLGPLVAASSASAAVWIELEPVRSPEALEGATWFEPRPATLLMVETEAGTAPAIWRLDLDVQDRAAALVEQVAHPMGDGVFLIWVPPRPASPWAVVPSGEGTAKAYTLSVAPDPWSDPRVYRRYRGATLGDGEAWPLTVRGPGLLQVSAQAIGVDRAAAVPFDAVLRHAAGGGALRRLPTSARIREGASVPRHLSLMTPAGRQAWELLAQGATLRVDAELRRVRPRLFARGSRGEENALAGPEAAALQSLADGRFEAAAATIEAWLDDRPDDLRALALLALVQGRVPPARHRALPALETALRQQALSGLATPDMERSAAHAWLQTSSFAFAGIGSAQNTEVVIAELPAGHGLSRGDADGRHLPGIYSRIPAGLDVRFVAPQHEDSGRWAVVNARALNRSGGATEALLSVDGCEPKSVDLDEGWTRLRFAVPPGERRVRLDLPRGNDAQLSIGVDLPLGDAPDDGRGPYLRAMHAARIDGAQPEARFTLPPSEGPAHVRVDAWWDGVAPRDLVLTSDLGRRRLVLHPAPAGSPLLWPVDDGSLSAGTAVVDLEAGVDWVSVSSDGGPVFVRVAARAPAVRVTGGPAEAEPADFGALAAQDLRRVSREIAEADSVDLRLARAALLLDMDLPAYAQRDVELAIAMAPAAGQPTPDALRDAVERQRGPHHVRVVDPPHDSFLLLGRSDAGGPHDDPGVLLAIARDALAGAEYDAAEAVRALAYASAVRRQVSDPEAARIANAAARATREDSLTIALSSPDRVTLTGPRPSLEPDAGTEAWARETMLGAALQTADRVLGAGTRWVVKLGDDAPRELQLEAFCDDLRVADPAVPDACHVEIRIGDRSPTPWSIPRGEVARTSLATAGAHQVQVALTAEGSARYMAVGLTARNWRVPDRRATFQLARPAEPVRFRVVGPTLLTLEAAPLSGTEAEVELLAGGSRLLSSRWEGGVPTHRSDQAEGFGPLRRVGAALLTEGLDEIEVRASGAPIAVRLSHRVPKERVLPPAPPAIETGDEQIRSGSVVWSSCRGSALRLPRPSRGGTVEASVLLWQRWSADEERSDRAHRFLEIAATHRLGLKRSSWFAGGAMVRLWPGGTPSAGAHLSLTHRFRPVDLRVRGKAQGIVQQVGEQTRGAMALRLRLDRPTRLGPGLTLVPHLKVRGYLQPEDSLYAWRDVADPEVASAYRREHPFGLGVGASLLWRPWTNGEFTVGLKATSNPNPASVDNAGGYLAFRMYPRPVGVALQGDLSRRFADEWRAEAWWRGEITVRVWLDLGPPSVWIRPQVRLGYLFDPSRLDATVGVSVTPGRRAATHYGPFDLLFDDLREPVIVEGRWRR